MSQKQGLEAPERALGTAACSWAAGTGWAPAGPGSYRDQIDQKWWRNLQKHCGKIAPKYQNLKKKWRNITYIDQ
jgi:hypothetical protein